MCTKRLPQDIQGDKSSLTMYPGPGASKDWYVEEYLKHVEVDIRGSAFGVTDLQTVTFLKQYEASFYAKQSNNIEQATNLPRALTQLVIAYIPLFVHDLHSTFFCWRTSIFF